MKHLIYSASMTPLEGNGSIDVDSLERMLERNMRHGVDGFFLLGTMGEGLLLPADQQMELVRHTVRIVGNRAEVLVNISDFGLPRTFEAMDRYRDLPVQAFVFQFPPKTKLTVHDPLDYLLRVADRSDRPLYYYHLPSANQCNLDMLQFRRILEHPKIKGMKNSDGGMMLRRELLRLKQDFPGALLFEGQEWSLDEAFLLGCDGGLCGMVSLASRIMVRLAKAAEAGDREEAHRLQETLIDIYHGIYGTDLSTVWIGQKYALQRLGVFSGYHSVVHLQNEALTEAIRQRIDECLDRYRGELED